MSAHRHHGYTLIELMIAVAIVAILGSIALPSYTAYVERSRVPVGLDALASFAARMEQTYQDTGVYGVGNCTPTVPTAKNFVISCVLTGAGGQGYVARATGTGSMTGYTYAIDNTGTRTTVSHPKGTPSGNCWSLKGKTCDS